MKNIFRVEKNAENPFVQMHKFPINDKRLSWKAKGILLYLLSKPNDWQVYEVDIVKHGDDGKTSVSSGIKELMKCGYITRKQKRNKKGKFEGYQYTVYEIPPETRKPDNGYTKNGKPNTTNNKVTNNNKTNMNGAFQKDENHDAFSFQEYQERFKVDEGVIELIDYFQWKRIRKTGKDTKLKINDWQKVIEVFSENKHWITDNKNNKEDVVFISKLLIDKYFDTNYSQSVDYGICHFIQPQIMLHAWWKEG